MDEATVVLLSFRDKDGNEWRAGAAVTKLRRGEMEIDATQATALGMSLTGFKVVIDGTPDASAGAVGPGGA